MLYIDDATVIFVIRPTTPHFMFSCMAVCRVTTFRLRVIHFGRMKMFAGLLHRYAEQF